MLWPRSARMAIEQDLASPRFVKTANQTGNCRFTRSASANERHALARPNPKTQSLNQWRFQRTIAECDVFQFQLAFESKFRGRCRGKRSRLIGVRGLTIIDFRICQHVVETNQISSEFL